MTIQAETLGPIAGPVIDVSEATFDREIVQRSQEIPVVIDFWAAWCGPCRTLGPILEKLAAEANGAWLLAKINVDENPRLAQMFGIQGIPAVKAVVGGRLVDEFTGVKPESQVRAWLKRFVPEAAPAEPVALDPTQLEAQYQAQLAADPHNAEALLELGRIMLRRGDPAGATLLAGVAEGSEQYSAAQALLPIGAFLEQAANAEGAAGWNSAATYAQAAAAARQSNYPAAFDALLAIVGRDRAYGEDAARKTMLALFSLLGDDDALVPAYRRQLANVLF